MKSLLNTQHISIVQAKANPRFAVLDARIAQHSSADFAFSIVSLHEQVLGAHAFLNRSLRPNELIRGYERFDEILETYRKAVVLPFDAAAVAVYLGLKAQRVRIGTMDLRIAAIALSRNLIVLTSNTRDFGKVPGLVTEDWTV